MNLKYYRLLVCGCLVLFTTFRLSGQAPLKQENVVPFLRYTPDARAAAMGDAGVAIFPDGHASSINAAKLPFQQSPSGIALSYNPWLKNLDASIHLSYLSAYHQLNNRNTIAAAVRYFSLGEVELTDLNQQSLGTYYPNEFAFDATFSRKFGPGFSMAATMRYISSQLMSAQWNAAGTAKASTALAVDLSAYHQWKTRLFNHDLIAATGFNLSNIGQKMGNAGSDHQYFLPTNLKIGTAFTFILPQDDRFSLAIDANKLLIPDRVNGSDTNNLSVLSAMGRAFVDEQGNVRPELKDVGLGIGAEYLFQRRFALRAGYNFQNPDQGNQSYFSVGMGFTYQSLGLNFAYLAAGVDKSPLANSLRFSLHVNFP